MTISACNPAAIGSTLFAATVNFAAGAATMIAMLVARRMAGSILLDHCGMPGCARHAFRPLRALGAGMELVERP